MNRIWGVGGGDLGKRARGFVVGMWQGEGVGCWGGGGFWRCTWGARVSCEQDAPSIERKRVKTESKTRQKRVKKESRKSQKRVKKASKKSSRPKKLKKSQIESKSSQNRVKIESKKKTTLFSRAAAIKPARGVHGGSSQLSCGKGARAHLSAQGRRGVSLGVARKGREGG